MGENAGYLAFSWVVCVIGLVLLLGVQRCSEYHTSQACCQASCRSPSTAQGTSLPAYTAEQMKACLDACARLSK